MTEIESTLGTPVESDNNENSPNWFDKNASEIADFFGGLFALTVGFTIFVIIYNYFYNEEMIGGLTNIILYLTLSIWTISLMFLIYFSLRARRYEEFVKNQGEKSADYIISNWSIMTLRAAAIPKDLIDCLEGILLEAKEKAPPAEELRLSDGWLIKLKERLGESRVEEFKEMLFKYTRRDNQQNSSA